MGQEADISLDRVLGSDGVKRAGRLTSVKELEFLFHLRRRSEIQDTCSSKSNDPERWKKSGDQHYMSDLIVTFIQESSKQIWKLNTTDKGRFQTKIKCTKVNRRLNLGGADSGPALLHNFPKL